MQYYLMTDIEMWSIVIEGFVTPTSEDGKILESRNCTTKQKWKAHSNAKATWPNSAD